MSAVIAIGYKGNLIKKSNNCGLKKGPLYKDSFKLILLPRLEMGLSNFSLINNSNSTLITPYFLNNDLSLSRQFLAHLISFHSTNNV